MAFDLDLNLDLDLAPPEIKYDQLYPHSLTALPTLGLRALEVGTCEA